MSNKFRKRLMKFKGFLWQMYSVFLLRHTKLNTLHLRGYIKKHNIDKLHLGCGTVLIKGWLNIGFERREEYGKITQREGALYLNYNLLKKWPFEDNSVSYIAASHFIEHFDLNGGIDFVKKAYRALRDGGVIRLSCPDLEVYAKNYVAGNRDFFENALIRQWCCFDQATTEGEIFAAKAYDSGGAHKWFYDYPSLKHILEAAGFHDIQRKTRLEGKTPDLETTELADREIETVYVEAIKRA